DVDAFSKHKFEGKIESISPATGAKFALLPPDNASGNFVKTVQRIPVKITFSNPNNELMKLLRPGMNVVLDVHLKEFVNKKSQMGENLVEYGSRRVIITITAIMCALLEIVDTTIVNVAMNDMKGSMGVSLTEIAWVVTAYAIA